MISDQKSGGKNLYLTLSPAWRWFWFPLLILYLFSVTIIYLWSQNEYATLISHIEDDEQRFVELYQSKISDSMDHIFYDLQWFSQQNALAAWLETDQPDELQELIREYAGLLSVRPAYYYLRLLDETGHEAFRIGWDGDIPVAFLQEQDKDKRNDLKGIYPLERGTVYISPMELNIDQGQIEVPYRPIIRFITPVYDIHERWRGSLVISYLASEITDVLRRMSDKVSGSLMLVNKAGYWLVAENPDDEWGSMIEERRERLFYRDYPESWVQMQPTRKGQFITEDGLFTFSTIDLQSVFSNSYQKTRTRDLAPPQVVAPDVQWKIISHVPAERLSARFSGLEKFKWIFLGLAFFASLLISFLFYRNRNRQQSHQDELEKMAFFDNLTGLTSRALFVDQLNDLLHLSRREGDHFALMVVDLDGFKQINDTFGHQGGDKLLCMVAERLQHSVRSTDTVARTGGDEFSIILSRVEHADVANHLAEKILKSLQLPFQISGRQCHIGASIGFSVSTDEEQDADILWKQADIAMYRAKQRGKNRICSFSGECMADSRQD